MTRRQAIHQGPGLGRQPSRTPSEAAGQPTDTKQAPDPERAGMPGSAAAPQGGIVAGRRGAGAVVPDADGRQSEPALDIVRGCRRLLASHGLSSLPELTLANGRRADIAALSNKGAVTIVEVKSSIADFESDAKWPDYLDFCDTFYFAVAPEFPLDRLPEEAGWIVADRYGGEIIRASPDVRLPAARRKAVHLAFARTAALRLQRLADPDFDLDAFARG